MIELKAIFEDGDYILTKMNATKEESEAYYLNRYFNFDVADDYFKKCVKVEILR